MKPMATSDSPSLVWGHLGARLLGGVQGAGWILTRSVRAPHHQLLCLWRRRGHGAEQTWQPPASQWRAGPWEPKSGGAETLHFWKLKTCYRIILQQMSLPMGLFRIVFFLLLICFPNLTTQNLHPLGPQILECLDAAWPALYDTGLHSTEGANCYLQGAYIKIETF